MSDRVQTLFEQNIRQVVKAYEAGEDLKVIAHEAGVSAPTVTKWLTQEGYRHKAKGRYPIAMKTRARDLRRRGWKVGKIANLLRVPRDRVLEWSGLSKNPILGGEKDPLKLKGKSGKKKKGKKGKGKKGKKGKSVESSKSPDYPPPRHKCRRHWTKTEEQYVIELMKKGVSVLGVYRRMRASKKRQARIWKKYGGRGMPPNFPPKKPRPGGAPGEFKAAEKKRKKLIADDEKRIYELESKYIEAQARIDAQKEEIEALKEKRQEELRALRAATEQRKALEAWAAKTKKKIPAAPKTRRVLPESYESEELGLPEGKPLRKKKPAKEKKPRRERPIAEWADNRKFFAVSKDWADLSDASDDELTLFADFLTKEGFPSKVTPSGDQPEAFLKDRWPRGIERKWIRATERATDFLETYQKRKAKLKKEKFSPQTAPEIVRYMANAYDAYRNPELNKSQKESAKKNMAQAWGEAGIIDQAIMYFYMGIAETNGAPTNKGVERGLAAKRMLTEDAERLAKRLGKKRKRMVEQEEREKAKEIFERRRREMLEGGEE